jgi:hypothetical protein
MSSEPSTLDKSMEEILVELVAKRVMSIRIQVSSTRELQETPSIERHSRWATEKRRKNYDNIANANQIPSVL